MQLLKPQFWQGYLKIHLTGYAPERFVSLCGHHNILLRNMIRLEEGYEFCIGYADIQQIDPLLEKTGTQYVIVEENGFPFLLKTARLHIGFFLGGAFFLVALYLLSGFIWDIYISGNTMITDEDMKRYLKEHDWSLGSYKNSLNDDLIAQTIRQDYPDISWVSISFSGTSMFVAVKEKIPENSKDDVKTSFFLENESEEQNRARSLVSSKDAVVTSITTRCGVPMVKKGDVVGSGDLLVDGCVPVVNDDGNVERYHYMTADADVWGVVVYDYYDSVDLTHQAKSYTGKKHVQYIFSTSLGHRLSVPWWDMSFETEDIIGEYRDFYAVLPRNFCISIDKITYLEYEMKTARYTRQKAEEILNTHLMSYLEKIKEKQFKIEENSVIIEYDEEKCTCYGTITVCQDISESIPCQEKMILDTSE